MAIDLVSLIGRAMRRKPRHGFLRDTRGATAVEIGLLALPFFAIIGAILETSMVFLAGQLLDSGVQDVSRLIRTGQAQAAGQNLEKFRTTLCTQLLGLFDCKALHIEVQTFNSFSVANISPPIDPKCTDKATCEWKADRPETYTGGAGSTIMVVQVYYKWPVILNFGGLNLANIPTGERVLGAAAVFRNEPFS